MKKILLFACALTLGSAVFGAGFQLYTEGSAEALGQAGAVSGRTNLLSLAWYNPAALAGTTRAGVMAGSAFVLIDSQFRSDISPTLDASMEAEWRSVPHFYYVQPVRDGMTAMLSVNAPYGLITEWDDGWIGSPAATYTELQAIYITPSLAVKATEDLALSAGFNVVYAAADLQAYRGPTLGIRRLEGDDIGFGYTASAHWQLADDWALGARYQSRVKLTIEGDTMFDNPMVGSSSVNADLELPASFNMGLANHTFEKLYLGLDVVWTEWSTYDQLVYNFGAGYPIPSNPEVTPKYWDDVWSIRLGGEYELSDSWIVRGGFVWDQSPIEENTRAPEMPGSDRQMLMTGLGWKGEHLGLDLAYSYLWGETVANGGSVNLATGGATAGEYDTETHLLAVSASYRF